jgi:hypothetical protein
MNFSRHSHLLFAVPLPCISRYIISNKAMSSQLPALVVRLQCLSCDTLCAGTGTVSRHVQIYCSVWVKDMNWILRFTILCRTQISRCDRLPIVSQVLSVVMYIIPVIKCSRPSAAAHIDSVILAVPHIERVSKFFIMPSAGRRSSLWSTSEEINIMRTLYLETPL